MKIFEATHFLITLLFSNTVHSASCYFESHSIQLSSPNIFTKLFKIQTAIPFLFLNTIKTTQFSSQISQVPIFSNILSKFTSIDLQDALTPERVAEMATLPVFSWVLDVRIIITVVGVIAALLYFFNFKNKTLQTIRLNIRPIFFALILMKYAFTIFTLIFFPHFYFTCSNLLFGVNPILFYSFLIDIGLIFVLRKMIRKENSKVIGNVKTIISNFFERIEGVKKYCTTRSFILTALLIPVFLFLLQVFGLKVAVVSSLKLIFSPITDNPIFQLFFTSSHYPVLGAAGKFTTKILDVVIGNKIPIISSFLGLIKPVLNLAIGAAVTYITSKVIQYLLNFYIDVLSKITTFRSELVNMDNEFDSNNNNDSDDGN
jgi:hypothetical protein